MTFIAAAMLEGYTGDINVGDPNVPDVAEGAVGEACGDPNVAWSKGDGSGSFLNVNGAGLFFCILLISFLASSEVPRRSSDVVDSANREGNLPLKLLLVESMLGRSVGTGGASEFEPMVCIEPLENLDIFDAIEKREYLY